MMPRHVVRRTAGGEPSTLLALVKQPCLFETKSVQSREEKFCVSRCILPMEGSRSTHAFVCTACSVACERPLAKHRQREDMHVPF